MTPVNAPRPADDSCLYTAALDAGDRLVQALAAGDLGGAARVLGERSRLIAAIRTSGPPVPSPGLADRFRDQDERLQSVLTDRVTTLSDAISTTGQTALAVDRYASASGAAAPVLDTAPRR